MFTSSDTDCGHRHVEMVKKALVGKVAGGFGSFGSVNKLVKYKMVTEEILVTLTTVIMRQRRHITIT